MRIQNIRAVHINDLTESIESKSLQRALTYIKNNKCIEYEVPACEECLYGPFGSHSYSVEINRLNDGEEIFISLKTIKDLANEEAILIQNPYETAVKSTIKHFNNLISMLEKLDCNYIIVIS